MTDAGDPPPPFASARRPSVGWWLPATVFGAVWILVSGIVFYLETRRNPAAQALAHRDFFDVLRAEWNGPPLYAAATRIQHQVSGPTVPGAEILPRMEQIAAALESAELARWVVEHDVAMPPGGRNMQSAAHSLEARHRAALEVMQHQRSVEVDQATRTVTVQVFSAEPSQAARLADGSAEALLANPQWLFTDPQLRVAARLQADLNAARELIAQAEEGLESQKASGAANSKIDWAEVLEQSGLRYMRLLDSISTLGDIVYEEPRLVIIAHATEPTEPMARPLLRAIYLSLGVGVGAGLVAAAGAWGARRRVARRRA